MAPRQQGDPGLTTNGAIGREPNGAKLASLLGTRSYIFKTDQGSMYTTNTVAGEENYNPVSPVGWPWQATLHGKRHPSPVERCLTRLPEVLDHLLHIILGKRPNKCGQTRVRWKNCHTEPGLKWFEESAHTVMTSQCCYVLSLIHI